ncbi:DUF2480 family protein [Halalkalibaculum sp. DA3122]|uniref:DUF2480 family protein n=1 Tax=unclassified Halalkalibaculum TaxID=2964617 RepID=UPI0037551CB1
MATAEGEIVNKVKKSKKLVTIDLQKYYDDTPVVELDLKDFLFKGLILKEDYFREKLEVHEWTQYKGQYLAVYCSEDAIITRWAYMLIAVYAAPHAKDIFEGREADLLFELYRRRLDEVEWSKYEDKFVLLKGCSDKPVPESVYLHATKKLLPHVAKLMYGEACSNVPVYRKQ